MKTLRYIAGSVLGAAVVVGAVAAIGYAARLGWELAG